MVAIADAFGAGRNSGGQQHVTVHLSLFDFSRANHCPAFRRTWRYAIKGFSTRCRVDPRYCDFAGDWHSAKPCRPVPAGFDLDELRDPVREREFRKTTVPSPGNNAFSGGPVCEVVGWDAGF